jgi:hypothetical protein
MFRYDFSDVFPVEEFAKIPIVHPIAHRPPDWGE